MSIKSTPIIAHAKSIGNRAFRFCFSDSSIDLMGDTIRQEGWDLKDYARNNVILWNHRADEPPIGKGVDVRVEGSRLMGTIVFPPDGTYDFADTVYRLVRDGFIAACSVGFQPVSSEYATDRKGGKNYLQQKLLECSLCCVPANQNALIDGKKLTAAVIRSFRSTRRIDPAVAERSDIAATQVELERMRRLSIATDLKAELIKGR